MTKLFIGYYRVSSLKQQMADGSAGYGMTGQQDKVRDYVKSVGGSLIGEFTECQSGRKVDRVSLRNALSDCKKFGAGLVISRLDRLGRDSAELLNILANSGVSVIVVDNPDLMKNKILLMVTIGLAELEADMIRDRTIIGLEQAKKRGAKLGGWRGTKEQALNATAIARKVHSECAKVRAGEALIHINQVISETGIRSFTGIANILNQRGIVTGRGSRWYAETVKQAISYQE